MRLAIYGGTFDPIHNAHLAVAKAAADRWELQKVLLIPAGLPPHKFSGTRASYADRYRMVELACIEDCRFQASLLEAGEFRSYSIHTIQKVAANLTSADELYFIIGADAFAEIETWYRWKEVMEAVRFIVVSRPGHTYTIPAGATVHCLDDLDLPVSSSAIRARIALGFIDVPVPATVLHYIEIRRLYR